MWTLSADNSSSAESKKLAAGSDDRVRNSDRIGDEVPSAKESVREIAVQEARIRE